MKKTLWNHDWYFVKKELSLAEAVQETAEKVNLPHTWNAFDGQDGGSDYVRGAFFYIKKFNYLKKEESVYLQFDGASSIADVYLNGRHLKHHEGGFSTFYVDLTSALEEENTLAVLVDNKRSYRVYPQNADFTFFGGIYRNVYLLTGKKTHFRFGEYGQAGVDISSQLAKGKWELSLDFDVENPTGKETVEVSIKDKEGKRIAKQEVPYLEKAHFSLKDIHLWNGLNDPYLYHIEARLSGDKLLDKLTIPYGFRTISIDSEKGFFLNGVSYPLHGVARHQDRENKGWAISMLDEAKDIALIKEMGANSIRLAHYQHSQNFYRLCDEAGFLVWAEIPYITTELPEGEENTLSQMQELILQNKNHPSIAVWGLSNEISIMGTLKDTLAHHKRLNELVHSLDASRATVMANLGALPPTDELAQVPDLIAYNIYKGWYEGDAKDMGEKLDAIHQANKRPLCLSEYGGEAVIKYQSESPRKGDYSETYQADLHEAMIHVFETRPYLWATYVWNMFDFAADGRNEGGVKGRNNKGLVCYDHKTRKDSFYVYKAFWSKEPFVHIASKRFKYRNQKKIMVKVYTNLPKIKIVFNGKETSYEVQHVLNLELALKKGNNLLTAQADHLKDFATFVYTDTPHNEYVCSAQRERIHNWFPQNLLVEKDGYFNIKDSVKDIASNPEALEAVKEVIDIQLAINKEEKVAPYTLKEFIQVARNQSFNQIFGTAGNKMPDGIALATNEKLIKIKK